MTIKYHLYYQYNNLCITIKFSDMHSYSRIWLGTLAYWWMKFSPLLKSGMENLYFCKPVSDLQNSPRSSKAPLIFIILSMNSTHMCNWHFTEPTRVTITAWKVYNVILEMVQWIRAASSRGENRGKEMTEIIKMR